MAEDVKQNTFDDYPEILEPKHIKEILSIGEKQTYELLNQEPSPFHFVRIGRRIKVPKRNFLEWLYGRNTSI